MAGDAGRAAIEVMGLRKSYGPSEVLRGLDFVVPTGKIVGFLGPNGAGKTTTLRILLGLVRPTAGAIRLWGQSIFPPQPDLRAETGYLPGETRFYPHLSGSRTLEFLAAARQRDCRSEIQRLASVFELDLSKPVRQYSSGMRRKLGLIQALMHCPKLVLLDEPTDNLDPLVRQTLFAELRRVVGQGRTVLFSSHTLGEVEELCDAVIILRAGEIVARESIDQFRQRAVRRVEVTWRLPKAGNDPWPVPLHLVSRDEHKLVFTWSDSVESLLRWLNEQSIADLAIGSPSLEELFLTFYRERGA